MFHNPVISRMLKCLFLFSVDDSLAVEVCLLLTEMYVSTYQLDKATKYLEFVETKLFGKPISTGGNGGKEEDEGNESAGVYRSKILLFKARLSLLHGNVKACKKDIKSLINSAGNVSILLQFQKKRNVSH